MIVLGVSGALDHDPSAALFRDGELVAAAEEERFVRDKHAKGLLPEQAARFCLEFAGVPASAIDAVAHPFAPLPWLHPGRWHYARRHLYAPDRALAALFNGNRRFRRNRRRCYELMRRLGIDPHRTPFHPVEHHLAHASSAYHLSGFTGKTAILGIDGKGEFATTFFGYGENGVIHRLREFYDPDSLGGLYGAMTEYLGFEMLDGEFKVMGMAPYGKPGRFDLSRLLAYSPSEFQVNTRLVNVIGMRRYKEPSGRGRYFSPALIDWLGPKREGDEIDDPYVDYAAAVQQLLEQATLALVQHYLGGIIRETGRLCFAGGVALNVKLNQRLMGLPGLNELFVQPAASDAGTALGAASYVAHSLGDVVRPLRHVYLGPAYSPEQCENACRTHPEQPHWERVSDPAVLGARILASGHPLAWFQGRMEFGPRALGNRSILGHPGHRGTADLINAQIKYRERWRPFCPSILDRVAPGIIQSAHPAPYMTFTFTVNPAWKERIPEVVHEDGTARVQIVEESSNPIYFRLLEEMERLTGAGVVLNTSLNRRGEPMVCSPRDALDMFFGSDLRYLMLGNLLVRKADAPMPSVG